MYTAMGNSPKRNALNAVTCFNFCISNMMFDYVTVIYDSYLGILGTRTMFHLWVITFRRIDLSKKFEGKNYWKEKRGTKRIKKIHLKNVTI